MISLYRIIFVIFSFSMITACQSEDQTTLSGTIDYVGSADIYISQQPLHYKYSDKIRHPLQPDGKGRFSLGLSIDSMQLARVHINDQSYPRSVERRVGKESK